MKVLILDTLLRQTADDENTHGRLERDVISRIHKEYNKLADLERRGSANLLAYINRQDGKPMIGVKGVFKYRLSAGDRIIYTRGDVLKYLPEEYKESIVLIAYSKHDDQEKTAENALNKEHDYVELSELASLAKEFKVEFYDDSWKDVYELLLDPSALDGHRILVVSEKEFLELDPDLQDVVLTESQDAIVKGFFSCAPNKPTLILGGAGTGKTVICMHVLNCFDNAFNKKTGMYFTQSDELLNKVENRLKYLPESKNTNDILLYNINDFCLEQLGLSRRSLVETRQFQGFINGSESLINHLHKSSLEPITVWTEIRGTIKGCMGKKWNRTAPMSQDVFKGSINGLVEKGYFIRTKDDNRKIELAKSPLETAKCANNDRELTENDIKNIEKACQHFSSFDYRIKALAKKEYLELSEEDTTIELERREDVWRIFLAYEEWLDKEHLFDENDLILKAFECFGNDLPECNLAVVDEVQDYTELQIFFLYKLVKNSGGTIFFAGDINQNVNPTYFSEDHLKQLFSDDTGLSIEHLKDNFRCSQPIVDVANRISDLRKKSIASHSLENEIHETAKKDGEKPYLLSYSKKNVNQLLETMMKYPRVALLVPDNTTREELIGVIGRNRYEQDSVTRFIYSVNEIKGMEYAYVICFNLAGHYKDIWNRILDTDEAKKKTKYRYYFNLLYVAATRAENYLGFVDQELPEKLENRLDLVKKESFEASELFFDFLPNSADEQLRQAHDLFNNGLYEDALHLFERLGITEEAFKCKQRIAEIDHNFDEALKYYILISPHEPYNRIKEVSDKSPFKKIHSIIHDSSDTLQGVSASITEAITQIKVDDEVFSKRMEDLMFDCLGKRIKDEIAKIREQVG